MRKELSEHPLVSLVIPVFNGMPYLKRAIESVRQQTYPNVELIVLDDGSTDDTKSYLAQHAASNCYVESHENIGQSATLNKGWSLAKGELIGYLSADDFLEPDAIENLVLLLQKNPEAVLAYGDNYLIDANANKIRKFITPQYSYLDMYTNLVCPVAVGALFYKSDFTELAGWREDLGYVPDYEFFLRLGRRGDFVKLCQVVGSYRVHEASESFKKTTIIRAEELKSVIESALEKEKDPTILVNRSSIMSKVMLVTARNHWRSRRYFLGAQYFLKSVLEKPTIIFSAMFYRFIFNALFNRTLHRVLQILRKVFKK